MKTQITVVMPAYREKKEQICQAIESILNQTYRDFEYIIVLDDPQNKELETLIRAYAEQDARISLYINEKNSGCPYSKDRGVRLADTKYVAIMDSDDIAKPYRLEKQLSKMESEKLDIIAGYVTVIDEEGRELYKMDNLPTTHEKIAKKMRVNNCMPHPTWFLRKEAYLELGGYSNIQGCEDYEFLLRAMKAGYRFGIVDEIVLDYRLSTHSISRNNLYKQYLMMKYLQDKYFIHKLKYSCYEEYEEAKFTEKRAEKYAKASALFETAIVCKTQKRYISMLWYVLRAICSSNEYAMKICRYLLQEQ